MTNAAGLPPAVARFFAAINDPDLDSLDEVFTDDISYQFAVPYPPTQGRARVINVLRDALTEADSARWDVLRWSVSADVVFVERVDRFWFGAREAAIECTGVFELRNGRIAAVRDYADLQTWRARKDAARSH